VTKAIGLGIVLVLGAVWIASEGGETGVRALIRASARISVTLFLLTFTASSFWRLWATPASAWLVRNRRAIGISFAFSHGLHLVAVTALAVGWPDPFFESRSLGRILGGALAYVFIALMALTSFDRSAAWLGRRRWTNLHWAGSQYIWLLFFLAYSGRASQAVGYAAILAALVGAMGLRLISPFIAHKAPVRGTATR